MLAVIGSEHFSLAEVLTEVALGVGIGILVPWSAIRLEQSRFFSAHATYRPLNAFAIGLLVLTISSMAHANELLAAFAAGITVATVGRRCRGVPPIRGAGGRAAEARGPARLRVFDLAPVPGRDHRVRLPLGAADARRGGAPRAAVSLLRSPLGWRERAAAASFGPKGLASVVFGLLILKEAKATKLVGAGRSAVPRHGALNRGVYGPHSSTDVLVARWLGRGQDETGPPHGPAPRTADPAAGDGPR